MAAKNFMAIRVEGKRKNSLFVKGGERKKSKGRGMSFSPRIRTWFYTIVSPSAAVDTTDSPEDGPLPACAYLHRSRTLQKQILSESIAVPDQHSSLIGLNGA